MFWIQLSVLLRDISFLYDVAAKERTGRGGDTARSKVHVHV